MTLDPATLQRLRDAIRGTEQAETLLEHTVADASFRAAANPTTVLALLDAIAEAERKLAERTDRCAREMVAVFEAESALALAAATARAEAAEAELSKGGCCTPGPGTPRCIRCGGYIE